MTQSQTLSHRFITALTPVRDRLYAEAHTAIATAESAKGLSPSALQARTEVALQSAIREGFAVFEKDPHMDPLATVEGHLAGGTPGANVAPGLPMPADIWARLVAAVQVEAARSTHSRAINPDSVLLSPDPLLAPRKSTNPNDTDAFDLSPPSRFLLAGSVAVLLAVIVTIYLLTRPMNPPPSTQPTTQSAPPSAATLPATAPAATMTKP